MNDIALKVATIRPRTLMVNLILKLLSMSFERELFLGMYPGLDISIPGENNGYRADFWKLINWKPGVSEMCCGCF